jgi:hypothetical protein
MNSQSYTHLSFDKSAKNIKRKKASSTNIARKTGHLPAEKGNQIHVCTLYKYVLSQSGLRILIPALKSFKVIQERRGYTLGTIGRGY